MIRSAVRRWNVITDSPTTSGWRSRDEALDGRAHAALGQDQVGDGDVVVRIDVAGERRRARRSACGSATGGMCSNESGIDSSSTFMGRLHPKVVRARPRSNDGEPGGTERQVTRYRKSRDGTGGIASAVSPTGGPPPIT